MAMAMSSKEVVEEVEKKSEDVPNSEFPPELLIKHPLQNSWTLWYYEPEKNKVWEDCQREISSFDTAEDFWSLYNHVKHASELKSGCDYGLFKQGIRPMWEDDANKNGGRWLLTVERKQRSNDLDSLWLEIILCMIGEGFNEYSEEICGTVVNLRPRQGKIAVWTRNAMNQTSAMEIGRKLKDRLKLFPLIKMPLVYQLHKDIMQKVGSMAPKITYTV